jgi:8-oxo-dGTP pyrophosphatase MutT (NUDIX family)
VKSPISSAERTQIIRDLLGKQVHVEVDRPIGHVHKGMVYPVNYGFIPGLMAGDGEEQDAYILGVTQPVEAFDGIVIGAVCRRDDVEDKLVVAPAGMELHQGQIAQAVHFQEQYFDTYIQCLLRKSCGVLPWRENKGHKEYLIVFESFSQCWSLPKGHMEAGETEEETALRELREETGLTAALDLQRRATIEYPISPFGRKRVVFFPGKVDGSLQLREGETEGFKWVTAEELADYLFPDTVAACRDIL